MESIFNFRFLQTKASNLNVRAHFHHEPCQLRGGRACPRTLPSDAALGRCRRQSLPGTARGAGVWLCAPCCFVVGKRNAPLDFPLRSRSRVSTKHVPSDGNATHRTEPGWRPRPHGRPALGQALLCQPRGGMPTAQGRSELRPQLMEPRGASLRQPSVEMCRKYLNRYLNTSWTIKATKTLVVVVSTNRLEIRNGPPEARRRHVPRPGRCTPPPWLHLTPPSGSLWIETASAEAAGNWRGQRPWTYNHLPPEAACHAGQGAERNTFKGGDCVPAHPRPLLPGHVQATSRPRPGHAQATPRPRGPPSPLLTTSPLPRPTAQTPADWVAR